MQESTMVDRVRRRWGCWERMLGRSDGEKWFRKLLECYGESHRAYHNVDHLLDCLELFDGVRRLAEHPDEVELALWFHDAVYDTHARDNEERSARLAVTALREAGADDDVTARIAGLILDTRHADPPGAPDGALTTDIDLSILGRDPVAFDAYERKIRREYAWVDEETFRSARIAALESFLRRRAIYHTSEFHRMFERAARANIDRSIRRLRRT